MLAYQFSFLFPGITNETEKIFLRCNSWEDCMMQINAYYKCTITRFSSDIIKFSSIIYLSECKTEAKKLMLLLDQKCKKKKKKKESYLIIGRGKKRWIVCLVASPLLFCLLISPLFVVGSSQFFIVFFSSFFDFFFKPFFSYLCQF